MLPSQAFRLPSHNYVNTCKCCLPRLSDFPAFTSTSHWHHIFLCWLWGPGGVHISGVTSGLSNQQSVIKFENSNSHSTKKQSSWQGLDFKFLMTQSDWSDCVSESHAAVEWSGLSIDDVLFSQCSQHWWLPSQFCWLLPSIDDFPDNFAVCFPALMTSPSGFKQMKLFSLFSLRENSISITIAFFGQGRENSSSRIAIAICRCLARSLN